MLSRSEPFFFFLLKKLMLVFDASPTVTWPYILAPCNIKIVFAGFFFQVYLCWESALILPSNTAKVELCLIHLQVLSLSWYKLIISSTDYLIVIHLQHFHLFSFSWNFLLFWFLNAYYLNVLNSVVSLSSSSFLLNINASFLSGASLVAQLVKNLPAMQETPVWFPGQEDLLEKG